MSKEKKKRKRNLKLNRFFFINRFFFQSLTNKYIEMEIVSLKDVKGEVGKPENILTGNPITELKNMYTDKTEQFFSGEWTSSPGSWKFVQHGEEFCKILKGKVKLTNEKGSKTYIAGDSFVIPDGFEGIWETVEELEKIYVSWSPISKL